MKLENEIRAIPVIKCDYCEFTLDDGIGFLKSSAREYMALHEKQHKLYNKVKIGDSVLYIHQQGRGYTKRVVGIVKDKKLPVKTHPSEYLVESDDGTRRWTPIRKVLA